MAGMAAAWQEEHRLQAERHHLALEVGHGEWGIKLQGARERRGRCRLCQELQRQQFEATCCGTGDVFRDLGRAPCSLRGKAEAPDVFVGSIERTAFRGRLQPS